MEELTKARKLYTPCLHCGLPLHPRELLCPHCETPVESRLPRLDWARAQVLEEYQRQWKRFHFVDLALGLLYIIAPMMLYFFLHFVFVESRIIRAVTTSRTYSEISFSHLAYLHYLLSSFPYLILCGLPITGSAFGEFGTSIFYRISKKRKYDSLYRFFPSQVSEYRRIYLLYYLLSLLLSLSIGHFFFIPSMRRYVYEGQSPLFFFPPETDLSLYLPQIHRFFSAYRFLYYALCFLFFIVYIYRYTTEKDSLCTHDIDERRKAAGIPVPSRYDG